MLRRPGATFTKARIDVLRRDERIIVANFLLTDDAGGIVVFIREARFQAIRTSRAIDAVRQMIHQTSVLASEPTAARTDRALALDTFRQAIRAAVDQPLAEDFVLLEGWATSVALRTARSLATANFIDIDALVASRRLPARARSWLETMLVSLDRSGLCHKDRLGRHIDPDVSLPEPDQILRTITFEHQDLSAEILVAASAMTAIDAIVAGNGETAVARFRLPQQPAFVTDFWGYLNPAISALTGHGFQHTYGRDFLYPGFLFVILKATGDFRAIGLIQHLLGLATGILMAAATWRGSRLIGQQSSALRVAGSILGLFSVAAYLTTPSVIHYEHSIRPEAIFPFFAVLGIWLNLEFIQYRWIVARPGTAAWLGAAQIIVSVIAYKLKPSFGFALVLVNAPVLVSLALPGMSSAGKATMIAGAAAFCILALIWPEIVLQRNDRMSRLFLPDTLLTIHADQIRDQIAEDLRVNRPSPFPPQVVRALLGRLDTTIAISSERRNGPYPSLGFNPDYLLYRDCVYNGVTAESAEGYRQRAALGYYYYERTFLHHPLRMFGKIGRQMRIFYRFGGDERNFSFFRIWRTRGARLAIAKDYSHNIELAEAPPAEGAFDQYPPARTFLIACKKLARQSLVITQNPLLTWFDQVLEVLYLPGMLGALLLSAWQLADSRRRGAALIPSAVALLILGYNFGNNLTISVVHSLDIARYIKNQLAYTLMASLFDLLFIARTLRELAAGWMIRRSCDRRSRAFIERFR